MFTEAVTEEQSSLGTPVPATLGILCDVKAGFLFYFQLCFLTE